ncbi:flagellar biosynthesis protein FliA [Goekera deserti]|uniref:flagellar biosynthesis protein FliA n=1 Tax=Goekera deserti TaxID=2497753 RepID=UPI001F38832A|nr:flagellar biosynthesis protein FliA [Goekera deserti]
MSVSTQNPESAPTGLRAVPASTAPAGLRRSNAPRARAQGEAFARGPLRFGGLTEDEGWALAPITTLDRVHFRVDHELPLAAFRAELPAGVTVTYDEGDGLYRVDGAPGQARLLAELVRSWCAVHGRRTIGLRPEPDVRRRQPRDLPPAFLEDLCRHYGPISLKRLQRNMSTIRLHLPDSDDIGQQVYEWILKAVGVYDEGKGVPFGAFLATQLSKWVHDLGRSAYGRTATDTENKQQKAIAAFITEHQRRPSERELAAFTGQSVDALRRNAQTVATLTGLRNLQSLDAAPEMTEGLMPDRAQASDDILGEAEQTLLSHALTAACAPDPTVRKDQRASLPNVLGWVTWYETTWAGKTKTQLAAELTTSVRNMNVHADRVQVAMRSRLEELAG